MTPMIQDVPGQTLKGQATNLSDVIYELLPAANEHIRN